MSSAKPFALSDRPKAPKLPHPPSLGQPISMIKMRMILAFGALFFFGALLAQADSETILSASQAGGAVPIGGNAGNAAEAQFVGIEFALDHAFNDVSITIPKMGFIGSFSGTAWLTNAVGSSAAPENVVASQNFGIPDLLPPNNRFDYTFLSDLDLSAGTYYFFLSTPICSSGCGGFSFFPSADATSTVSTAPGASFVGNAFMTFPSCSGVESDPAACAAFNSIYPPALPWDFVAGPPQFAIDITRDAPEPETILLFFTGLVMVGLSRLAQRRPGAKGKKSTSPSKSVTA